MEKVQRWRGAFVEAGKISGYHLLNFKDEAECVKKLVDDIFPKSLQTISPFPESLVGMKSQVEKVTSLLDMESNDVRSIGIWGMGGIGKTELARVLYERYCHQFEANCFLGGVGTLHQKNGLAWLVQVVIRKLLGEKKSITSEHEGVIILKNRLRSKKVLFILDDVNHRDQLKFLVGEPDWFGMGSRIILTARDKHLLISHVRDNVYEVQLLSEDEALELFSMHAFREKSPKEDFMELSREVVNHAGGLPLALEVLGSLFYSQDKRHWKPIIDRLNRIPPKDILGKIRLSFDGLDKDEKELFLDIAFLDIACLTRKNFDICVEQVQSDVSRSFLIDCLIKKSLLSIKWNSIVMHNMIREMGENVIREEYANSRIWLPEEVCDLFKGKLITEKVESLCIPKYYYFEDDLVNYSNIFRRMQSVKILIISDGTFSSNCAITYLPSSLQFIDWPRYPSVSLPESFEPSQLIVLCLRQSWLVELWPISKKFSNLKHLDLRDSCELTKTPNFGDIPNLEKLHLEGCVNLEEVHPSLGHCRMLTYLSLYECHKLKKLPKFVCMKSLETLNLRECTRLEEFPEICGDMRRLSILNLGSPWIRSLPPSLSGLRELHLDDCEILESIPDTIRNLSDLSISGCNKLATLPNSLFESQKLEYLEILRCSGLVELPSSLGVQKNLGSFEIYRCENLKKLPSFIQMESLLQQLVIANSPKLDTFPEIKGDMHCLEELTLNSTGIREMPSSIGNLSGLTELNLTGCEDLVSLPDSLCNLMNLRHLLLRRCKRLEKLPENIHELQELEKLDASETAISQPPSSITKLGKLWQLRFSLEQQFQHSSNFVLHQVSGLSSLTLLDLSNLSILGGLPEDLGSLHSLENLNVSGSNISCLPKSFKGLLHLQHLNVQFCQNLNELPGELPPNLMILFADYHLALKIIKDLVINCLKLYKLGISNCGTVSSEQVNVFLQHFLRTCIQFDFLQRDFFLFFLDQVGIPELFDYDRFINQKEISIDLNPSWYTDKFMGFWICYCPSGIGNAESKATLVCKSDPERKYSLEYDMDGNFFYYDPSTYCVYIPFETLWNNASGNKEGKNPNDYYMLEVSQLYMEEEVSWGIRLVYEKEAMSD
ncbi:hypothetical protein KY285_009622 [Solanum tuberosum]|nr:hypothetical protein KY285_009622 [Solanum tuberosum]